VRGRAVPQQVLVAALLPPGCDGPALAQAFNAQARAFGRGHHRRRHQAHRAGALAFAVTAVGRCPSGAPWRRSGAHRATGCA
jgi:hypothetical protein